MSDLPIHSYTEEVRALIKERLKIKGATLDRALAKAGRLLPNWAQRAGRTLTQADLYLEHPKLHRMIDDAAVEKAHRSLVMHLESVDPKERRKAFLLSILGSISFGLIVVVVALVTYLWWRGFV